MRGLWAVAVAGLILAACASTPPAPIPPVASNGHPPPPVAPPPPPPPPAHAHAHGEPPPSTPSPTQPYRPFTGGAGLASLSGWGTEDHLAALLAFQAGCSAARDYAMRDVCQRARALTGADDHVARQFFEENFRAEPLNSDGLMTAYFAPEYEARGTPDGEFSMPVRPKPMRGMDALPVPPPQPAEPPVYFDDPDDPIGTALAVAEIAAAPAPPAPAPTYAAPVRELSNLDRAAIERMSGDGALAWMRAEDLFFLQIQGSGTLVFPDGRRMKATYAGDNGRPFVAIARPMVNQGLLGSSGASGDNIRAWLAAHRGAAAQQIMWMNPRYVFFATAPDDGREPAGAAGIPLPAGRAIAIDPGRHTYGEVYWIDASAPTLAGAAKTYHRLAMALDTGSAIRGEVRADLYIGRGTVAGIEAGRVRHTLRMTRLVPIGGSAPHETAVASRGD